MAKRYSMAMYKRTTYPQEILSQDEVERLMNACSKRAPTGIRNRALICLLYRSGIRISEALSLTETDLDRANLRLWVRPHKSMAYWAQMDEPGWSVLDRWLAERSRLGLSDEPIFCTLKGGSIRDNYVRTLLPRLARKAGIKRRVHPHALRHTFASELSDEGIPITEIQEALGHHNLSTTSVYIGALIKYADGEAKPPLERKPWDPDV